jgi:hypothetical protein
MDNGVSTKSTSQLFFTAHHFWECCLANWVSTYLYILSLNPLPFNSGFSRSLWSGGGWERGDSQTQNTGALNQSTHWAKVGLFCLFPLQSTDSSFPQDPSSSLFPLIAVFGCRLLCVFVCCSFCIFVFLGFAASLSLQSFSLCLKCLFVFKHCSSVL